MFVSSFTLDYIIVFNTPGWTKKMKSRVQNNYKGLNEVAQTLQEDTMALKFPSNAGVESVGTYRVTKD